MTPGRILGGQPEDQVSDLFGHGWPAGAGVRVGPFAGDQLPVPTQQGRRRHAEDRPPAAVRLPKIASVLVESV
jgi:hypothetical protein